jgi:hypothetical protein
MWSTRDAPRWATDAPQTQQRYPAAFKAARRAAFQAPVS